MNSNFNAPQHGQPQKNNMETNRQNHERFDLLSAYLDGEVTPAERQQVQSWLDNEPQTKELYHQLLKIRQGLRTLPVPCEQSVEDLQKKVFTTFRTRRLKRVGVLGGGAIAAIVIGAVSMVLPGNQSPLPQFASSEEVQLEGESLMIAINKPTIEIPKAAVSNIK